MPKFIAGGANLKGGVGKSAVNFCLGGLLAERKRVLFVDCDPQSNLTYDCGIDVTDTEIYTVKDIFDGEDVPEPKDIVIEHPVPGLPKLDVIPSSIFLFDSEERITDKENIPKALKKYFDENAEYFSKYAYVFLDTNPSMSLFNQAAFYLADEIILISDVSSNSILGAELFCQIWDRKRMALGKEDNIAALLLNNYTGNTLMSKDLVNFTRNKEFSKDIILDTILSTTIKIKEAESMHRPITQLYPKHKISDQYRALMKELKGRNIL